MAVTTTLEKTSVNIKLNAGGGKTVSVSLGSLDKSAFDAQKAMNIVNLYAEITDKSIAGVQKVDVSSLSD